MKRKDKYLIGAASKICNISKKTLRFYDSMGILPPDEISDTGYRYYKKGTLLRIPIVKYYKQMGYTLEEIANILNSNDYAEYIDIFKSKMFELKEEEKKIHDKYTSLKDWYELILEARSVKNSNNDQCLVKFIKQDEYLCLKQEFEYDYIDSILNIDWVNHLEKIDNEITGPVILKFDSYKDKMNSKAKIATIMQKPLKPVINQENICYFAGKNFVSYYHVGDYENIKQSYDKLIMWSKEKGYKLEDCCYERYVVDYWTTMDETKFVTEILIPISE